MPFTIRSVEKLKRKPGLFKALVRHKKKSKLQDYLKDSDTVLSREEYLNICLRSFAFYFIFLYIISTTILALIKVKFFYLLSFAFSLAFAGFIFFSQRIYPKIYAQRKEKNIERNLIPALEDMLVQLTSGIPIFSILVSIASSNYGVLSQEFKKAVSKINAGSPQIQVLEEMGEKSSSPFFRRTLWQLSNGMKAGSDMSIVVKDSINILNQEQLIQIQNYGNKLNPLIMFYMLTSVILPALAITFLTILASIIGLPATTATLLFVGMYVLVILLQIMFLGVIRSARPSLL